MKAELEESFDKHDWKLQDLKVTQLVVDPASLRVVAWHLDGSADLRLGVPFTYTEPDGSVREIDPAQADQVAPLLGLVSCALDHIVVHRSGGLDLEFGDGSSIQVIPHPQFEAWEARGAGVLEELAYLCAPGGGSPWGAA